MNPTNAPTPVTLADGSIVLVSPLTSKDMMTVFNFVRQKELTRLLTAIPKDSDVETRKIMIKLAYEESNNFDISQDSLIWNDLDVIRQIIFISLKKETMGMTMERVEKITDDESNMEKLLTAINPEPKSEEVPASVNGDEQKKTL